MSDWKFTQSDNVKNVRIHEYLMCDLQVMIK